MTPEGWALLWIGAINVVWASIFVGVLLFALRTDTEADRHDLGGPGRGSDPPPPGPPQPRGAGHEGRPRLRGAELAAARRRRRRSGGTYHPRVHRW